jgi:phosphoenolpyruvate carboxylase
MKRDTSNETYQQLVALENVLIPMVRRVKEAINFASYYGDIKQDELESLQSEADQILEIVNNITDLE